MTVTVTNDAGQPQAGVAVLLTRDYAYSRGAVDKQYIEPRRDWRAGSVYNFAGEYDADAGCTCGYGSGV